MKKVVIVGGGFAGINAAKILVRNRDLEVTLIDRRNHHLFQPLLYQVAMAGLSPAEIAVPIRSLFSSNKNIRVLSGNVTDVDKENQKVITSFGEVEYDYLMLACGSKHTYFGNNQWEEHAPGLKTVEQATEIRRRVLAAFEEAERLTDRGKQKRFLTFVIVGGGPTGVELAGAIGEMSRFTLSRDFRNIVPQHTRIILVEAGPRILPTFSQELSDRAMRDLEKLGVQIWTNSMVSDIDKNGVQVGSERVEAATVLWAAGVRASSLGQKLGVETDRSGRVMIQPDCSIPGHANVFVAGDMAHFKMKNGGLMPGVAPAALQQGRFIAKTILNDLKGKPRGEFAYLDKGQMATIGRSRAIAETGRLKIGGFLAWIAWLLVHIYYLTGFKNRFFVILNWAWSYLSFHKGARLIIQKEWRMFSKPAESED